MWAEKPQGEKYARDVFAFPPFIRIPLFHIDASRDAYILQTFVHKIQLLKNPI